MIKHAGPKQLKVLHPVRIDPDQTLLRDMPAELVGASYRCCTCGQELAEERIVISGSRNLRVS